MLAPRGYRSSRCLVVRGLRIAARAVRSCRVPSATLASAVRPPLFMALVTAAAAAAARAAAAAATARAAARRATATFTLRLMLMLMLMPSPMLLISHLDVLS